MTHTRIERLGHNKYEKRKQKSIFYSFLHALLPFTQFFTESNGLRSPHRPLYWTFPFRKKLSSLIFQLQKSWGAKSLGDYCYYFPRKDLLVLCLTYGLGTLVRHEEIAQRTNLNNHTDTGIEEV